MKKISQRITTTWLVFFAYLSLFLLLSIAVVTDIVNNRKIATQYNDLSDRATVKLMLLLNSRENVETIQNFTIDKVFHPSSMNEEKDQQLQKLLKTSEDNLEKYKKLVGNDLEKKAFIHLQQQWNENKKDNEIFLGLKNNEKAAIEYYHSIQQKSYKDLQNSISSLSVILNKEIDEESREADLFFTNSSKTTNFLIAVAEFILIIIGLIIFKNVKQLRMNNRLLEKKDREQKEIYDQLVSNQAHLLASQQISKTGSWELALTDTNQICKNPLTWSDETFRIFGYKPGEIQVTNELFFSHIPAEDQTKINAAVQFSLETGIPYEMEHRIVLANGEVKTVYERSEIIYNKNGHPSKMIGTCQDITEQKLIHEKIKSSEKLYRSIFNSGLPKWVVDAKTLQILEINDAAVEHYGYTKEEFLQMTVYDIRCKETHEELNKMIQNGTFAKMKKRKVNHVKKNGKIITVEITVLPIQYKGRDAFLGLAYDITDLLKLEQELMNERLNKQIEITRATISAQEKERHEVGRELHDNVNQILSTAKLFVESAMHNKEKQGELFGRGINLINTAIEELRKLSKTLEPPSLGGLSLREAIEELAEDYRQVNDNNIELCIEDIKDEELGHDLRVSIYRIIQEQLTNIRKYASATKVKISLGYNGNLIDLKIEDNGKGFDLKAKRKGLGITNIINRVEVYNGQIKIDTAPGCGCKVHATFLIDHIPVIEVEESKRSA